MIKILSSFHHSMKNHEIILGSIRIYIPIKRKFLIRQKLFSWHKVDPLD